MKAGTCTYQRPNAGTSWTPGARAATRQGFSRSGVAAERTAREAAVKTAVCRRGRPGKYEGEWPHGGLRTPCGATNPARATWPRKARTGLPVRLPPHGGLGTTRGRGTAPETRKVRSPKGTGIAWRGRKLERGRSRTQALSPRGEAPGRGRNRGSGRARGPRPIRGGVSRPHGDSHGRPEAVNRGPVPAIRGQPRRAPAKQGPLPGADLGATLAPLPQGVERKEGATPDPGGQAAARDPSALRGHPYTPRPPAGGSRFWGVPPPTSDAPTRPSKGPRRRGERGRGRRDQANPTPRLIEPLSGPFWGQKRGFCRAGRGFCRVRGVSKRKSSQAKGAFYGNPRQGERETQG